MTLSISRRQRRLLLARRYLLYSSSTKRSAMRESWSGLFKNAAALWLFVLLSRHPTSVAHTFHFQNFLLNLVRRLKICLLLYSSLTTLVAIFFSIYVLRVFINQMVLLITWNGSVYVLEKEIEKAQEQCLSVWLLPVDALSIVPSGQYMDAQHCIVDLNLFLISKAFLALSVILSTVWSKRQS